MGEDYDFEEFARAIEAFVLSPEASSGSISVPEAEVKADDQKSEKPVAKEKSVLSKTAERSSVEAKPSSQSEGRKKSGAPYFYVLDATIGHGEFVSRSEVRGYLAKQDKSHRIECSVAEYSVPKREDRACYIENLYFSYPSQIGDVEGYNDAGILTDQNMWGFSNTLDNTGITFTKATSNMQHTEKKVTPSGFTSSSFVPSHSQNCSYSLPSFFVKA